MKVMETDAARSTRAGRSETDVPVEGLRDAVLAAPLGAVVPVWRALVADTETPVSAYLKLRRGGTGFLLESSERDGRLGRYSFVGSRPDAVLRADLDRGTIAVEAGITAYRGAPLDGVRALAGEEGVWTGGRASARHLPGGWGVGAAELPGFSGGLVGAFAYDLAATLERLPRTLPDDTLFPAAIFARYHTVLAFDHVRQRMMAVSLLPAAAEPASRLEDLRRAEARIEGVLDALRRGSVPAAVSATGPGGGTGHGEASGILASDTGGGAGGADPAGAAGRTRRIPDDEAFMASVREAVRQIRAGEAIQVVLSRRLEFGFDGDPFDLYRALRRVSPAPYMFFLEFPEVALAGSSPEMLVRVEGDAVQVSPIAGTRRRGGDPDEDARLEAELRADPKERSEHVMLVDLGRNDLGRVCRVGSVHVPRLMEVDRFSHVMHLVSVVTGRLREDRDALDAFAACFPAGTVSGAPKIRAMELIEELETVRRGAYAGAVAHVAPGATSLDACITIRTIVLRGGRALVQAGAGIVADSRPERELSETGEKARALLEALELAGAVPLPPLAASPAAATSAGASPEAEEGS
jgi:anthranilate synthase component I